MPSIIYNCLPGGKAGRDGIVWPSESSLGVISHPVRRLSYILLVECNASDTKTTVKAVSIRTCLANCSNMLEAVDAIAHEAVLGEREPVTEVANGECDLFPLNLGRLGTMGIAVEHFQYVSAN